MPMVEFAVPKSTYICSKLTFLSLMPARLHIPPPDKVSFWLAVVVLLRFATSMVIFWLGEKDPFNSGLWHLSTDAIDFYVKTATNLAMLGIYSKDGVLPYAGRMPGYDIIIAPLFFFFDQPLAFNLLVVTQWSLTSLSYYLLALLSYNTFHKVRLFYIVIIGISLNTYIAYYDFYILTESFAVSAVIIGIYFVHTKKSKLYLLLSGTFFTWAFFLRPYLLAIYILAVLYIIWIYRYELRILLVRLLYFGSIFILFESMWIIRNYIHFQTFIPVIKFDQLVDPNDKLTVLGDFMRVVGGDNIYWNPTAEIMLFLDVRLDKKVKPTYQHMSDLPSYMFTSAYNADSLEVLKYWYVLADTAKSPEMRSFANMQAVSKMRYYMDTFKKEKPLYYYIVAPLRLLGKFLIHSGTYNLSSQIFSNLPTLKKVVRLIYGGLYYFTWVLGLLGCIIILSNLRHVKDHMIIVICITGLYPLVMTSAIFRTIEYRHFALAYPFLFVIAVWTGLYIIERFIARYRKSHTDVNDSVL